MQNDPGVPGGQPLYRVTRQEDSSMLAERGGFQRSKKVFFTLADGTSSYVEVPITGYTKDNVRNLIEQHVGDILEVANIQGPQLPPTPG